MKKKILEIRTSKDILKKKKNPVPVNAVIKHTVRYTRPLVDIWEIACGS